MSTATPSNDDYQARQDMQTLLDAHKVRSDKKRHKAALAMARQHAAALQKVTQEAPTDQPQDDEAAEQQS